MYNLAQLPALGGFSLQKPGEGGSVVLNSVDGFTEDVMSCYNSHFGILSFTPFSHLVGPHSGNFHLAKMVPLIFEVLQVQSLGLQNQLIGFW